MRLFFLHYQLAVILSTTVSPPTTSAAEEPSITLERAHKAVEYSTRASHYVWETTKSMPGTVLLGAFCFLVSYSLISLLLYHAVLISVAQTTNERVRGVYQFRRDANPANAGCIRNWWRACCTKHGPSRLPPFDSVVKVPRNVVEHVVPADAAVSSRSSTKAYAGSVASSLNDQVV